MVRIFWWCLTDLYSFIWGCADCCVGGGGTRLRRLIDSETSRNINRLSPWHSGTKSQKNVQSRVLLFKSHCCHYLRFNAHYEFLMVVDDQALIKNYTTKLNKKFHWVIVCALLVLFCKSCCCLEQDGLDIPSYENVHWSNFDHLGC